MPAFQATEIQLTIPVDHQTLELNADAALDEASLRGIDYGGLIKQALREAFPEVRKRKDKKELYSLASSGAEFKLRDMILANPALIGGEPLSLWIKADDDIDTYYKLQKVTSRISEKQIEFVQKLAETGQIRTSFNTTLFTASDSREPEQAGIRGALLGSFWTLLVTLLLSMPVGIAAAIYLEEFAPKNRFTDFIEININNLAAVPSIVFGLLGLAVFGTAGRRPGAVTDDPADDHYIQSRGTEIGTAIDQGGRPGSGCLPYADGFSPCPAAGDARYPDRCDHRHGPGPW